MRVVAGIALIEQGAAQIHHGAPVEAVVMSILALAAAVLLLIGLWTPVMGVLAALVEAGAAFSPGSDPWVCILLGTLGLALALLGPGAWSVDARLFGWKRIDLRDRPQA